MYIATGVSCSALLLNTPVGDLFYAELKVSSCAKTKAGDNFEDCTLSGHSIPVNIYMEDKKRGRH